MKKFTKTFGVILGLAALAGAALFWWTSQTEPVQVQVSASLPTTPKPLPALPPPPAAAAVSPPAIAHPIEAIAPQQNLTVKTLPELDAAETHVRRALSEFMSAKDITRYLRLGQFVRHVVATVDNLPREHAPAAVWPVNPMPEQFSTGQGDGSNPLGPIMINANNNARYTPFVNFVTALDTGKAVALYVQLYPLFQQAYVELGYPDGYFNDRLVAVIDHLLAAPVHLAPLEVRRVEVRGAYQPLRPWVTYEFTDPTLNALSAGQKMLLRTGAVNHQRLRTKLMDFRKHLTQAALAALTTPAQPQPQ